LVDLDPELDGVQGIELTHQNPWRGLALDTASDRILVASTGDSFALDGAIEVVDPIAGVVSGILIDEETLGSEIEGIAYVSRTQALVLAGGSVMSVDPTSGTPTATSLVESVVGMQSVGTTLYTWAREGELAGIRTFDLSTGEEKTPAEGSYGFGDLPVYSVAHVQ
jgi:hypothetical protein